MPSHHTSPAAIHTSSWQAAAGEGEQDLVAAVENMMSSMQASFDNMSSNVVSQISEKGNTADDDANYIKLGGTPPPPKKKVLLVCTSVSQFPDGSATGWYLPEAAHPYQVFIDAGIEVTWASIAGGEAPCDPGSVDASAEDAESMAFWNNKELVAKTSGATGKLDDFKAEDFDGIFFAGGFGVMWDFPDSAVAQKLIVEFYEAGKPTAAVCHGPIVFKNVKLSDGSVLVAGKEVTGFTNAEEEAVGKTEVVAEPSGPGSCEDVLTAAGATFKDGGVFQANVCIAGALITGQNPPSAKPTAEAVVAAMKASCA